MNLNDIKNKLESINFFKKKDSNLNPNSWKEVFISPKESWKKITKQKWKFMDSINWLISGISSWGSDRWKIYLWILFLLFFFLLYSFISILFILSKQTNVLSEQRNNITQWTEQFEKLKKVDLDKIQTINLEEKWNIADFLYNLNRNLQTINVSNYENVKLWNIEPNEKDWTLKLQIVNISTYKTVDSILLSFIYNKKYYKVKTMNISSAFDDTIWKNVLTLDLDWTIEELK